MGKQLIYNVEDDESIRELIKYALENEGFEVISFENAEDMLFALQRRCPELIVLDIMLPQMDGIEALKFIRSTYKNLNIKIIMLTAKGSEINKVNGLDSGADDYIVKPFSILEFTARVKANLRKYNVEISKDSYNFGEMKLKINSREVIVNGQIINLTLKEFELLKILMQESNSIISRERLLKEVWGYDYFGDTRTLDIHINTLRKKLDTYCDNIVTVRGVGYMLKES